MFACVMIRGCRSAPQSYATATTLLEALTPYDQGDVQGHWADERMLMAQALTWNTPQSRHETTPETCAQTGRMIVAWARLDNRPELCALLGTTDSDTVSDPQIILASHHKWGAKCADRLEGDFSFVIYDPTTHQAFCARDSIGARPLYYYVNAQVFVAATTAAVFPLLKQLSITPSRAWMARYMADAPHDMEASAFEGVRRLAPAHVLQVDRQGAAEPQAYFRFHDTAPTAGTRDPHYVAEYRAAFHRATEVRLRSDFAVGAESSGGLDSSSIVGHAVNHLPHDIDDFHCFGLCNYEQEPEYLLETSIHCGVRHNHITTHTQMHEDPHALARTIRVMGHPAEHGQAQWHSTILRQCEQFGIRTLLSGYGGDEMVTHQAVPLHRELFHNRQLRTLAREMHGNAATRWLRYLIRLRRLSRRAQPPIPDFVTPLVDHALLQQEVIDEFDLRANFAAGYHHQSRAQTLNEHMLRGPEFAPRRVARLEACALVAHSYKVDYRWPLYDRPLMQQFLRTPAIEKRHKAMGRYLHRRAVTGSIPDKVTWKQSKDLGGFTTGLEDRRLPAMLTRDEVPAVLASVLDFDKLGAAHIGFASARAKNAIDETSILQINSLWRASLLARWLGSSTPS